jgi:threonine/homoserine/homoserine lactone efflux protein
LPNLLMLAGMHILMAMVPGPNTVVVSYYAATVGRRTGLLAVSGIVLASLVWVVLSLVGVGALLQEAGWLYRAMRIVGALYLFYVGVMMLRASARRSADMPAPARPFARSPFLAGLLTTLSNPKSAVFWTSAFLVAVPAHAPLWFYVVVVGVIGIQSSLWYGTVALVLSTGFARRHYQRLAATLDRIAGVVMIALGAKLANEVRAEIAAEVAR